MHAEPQIHAQLKQALPEPARYALPLAVIFACAAGILAWNWTNLADMARVWRNSETFAHGFVVLPVFLLLVWLERDALARAPIRPFLPALGAVALAGAAWLVGKLAGASVLQELAVIAMIPAATWAALGSRAMAALLFPMAFLVFAVPMGQFLVPQLIDLTADFTVFALKLSGIPVYRDGNSFEIPSGRWSVVEACSGIRYLVASLMGGVLFAHFFYRSWTKRAAFIAFSIVMPLVANWLRAYLIVMLGHVTNNRLAVGVDHLVYGWIFFGLVVAATYWVGARWADPGTLASRRTTAHREPAPARPAVGAVALTAALALVLAGAWRPAYDAFSRADPDPVRLDDIHARAGWSTTPGLLVADWMPLYANAAASRALTFARGGDRAALYVAYYRDQDHRGEMIHHGNGELAPEGSGWTVVRARPERFDAGPAAVDAQAQVLRSRGRALLVWRWYWIAGHATGSEYAAKAWLAWSRLSGQGEDSAVIVAYVPIEDSVPAATAALRGFVSAQWPAISHALERTRAGTRP